ncbi:MAG: amino acid ABC transporter permease [Deinococcales bacterium]
MSNSIWDFSVVWRHFGMLLRGLAGSLELTLLALALGLVVGLIAALLKLSPYPALRAPANAYITFFRTTPPLVQLFWFFYAFPILIHVRFGPFEAAVFALTLQSGSFFAEIFRGGIQSIERGQWEAGRALGMNYGRLMRRIILPQAVKRMIPPFFVRAIELFKTTTLVSTIAFADLLYQADVLSSQTFRPLTIYTVVAAMYFLVIFAASMGVRGLERRLARADA